MGAYVGINSTPAGGYTPVARKIKKIYVGDENGIARLVKKAYVGVDGVAKLFWNSAQEGPTFIDYIESTGTQWIDTGVKSTSDIRIEATIYGDYKEVCWYGGRTHVPDTTNYYGIYNYNGRFDWLGISGEGKSYQTTNLSIDEWHTISHGVSLIIDGTTLTNYNADTFNTDYNIYIFAGNNAGTATRPASIRIKSFKIYNGSTLVRDFRPYKDANGVICLYDLVEGKCYYNQGTGTFISGEEINTDQVVNYLMLYDSGDECVDVTGGWKQATFKSNGYTSCTFGFSKNATNIFLEIYGKDRTSFPRNSAVTEKPFPFSQYKGMGWNYQIVSQGLSYGSISTNQNITSNTESASFGSNTQWLSNTSKSVHCKSVEGVPDTYYPVFYQYGDWSQNVNKAGYMYSSFVYKQDNWQELCTIAGLTSSDYTDEASLCADSTAISTILSNANAVEFMIKQCTGSFMSNFVASSTCLTALNNSTYKTTIHANEHWSKFLNMVA